MGLGLVLYQEYTFRKMVSIFHVAGHTVGINTLCRIDSSIANNILRRYEQNGYKYIPTGISPYTPGRIILSSFDIDVLEETIDGKNTSCATQCVLWQHGPPSPPEQTTVKTSWNRIPDQKLLEKFHTIDIAPVYTGARPYPIITSELNQKYGTWETDAKPFKIFQTKLGYWLVCTTKINRISHHGQLSMLHVVFRKQQ